ncbi:MAG: PilZ domain-containing protein [Nitrospirae bacterium]|nr:PilZ domain-containing protein [Nitrospirota bacterium]
MAEFNRKYPRIPLSGLALIEMLESETRISGPIEEISRRGIGVYTKEKVIKGSRVKIKLFCDVGKGPVDYQFSGKIRTEEKKKEFGSIGIEFENEINATEHQDLYQYLVSRESNSMNS